MTVSAHVYGLALKSLANKEINFPTDTLNVMLCTSSYVPNQDTDQYKSAVTGEVTGTGYTAGGQALTSVTWTYNASTNAYTLDAADSSWPSSTITARYAVIYDATPATDATRPLIAYVDFGADVAGGTELTIMWDAAGICSFTVA